MNNTRHGRGPILNAFSPNFLKNCNDRFCHMFSGLAKKPNKTMAFTTSNINLLDQLGSIIGSKVSSNSDSSIPSGYTYLGQFIDHDITLDAQSDINIKNDPSDILNFRSSALDLDSVYGRGPNLEPYLYFNNTGDAQEDGIKLLIGINQNSGTGGPHGGGGSNVIPSDFDVPRNSDQTAIIGDPRNNENLIVSQIHHAFLKFHNAVVDHLKGTVPDAELFSASRQLVTHHYQWIVANDFLKTIAIPAIVDSEINSISLFKRKKFCMPVEFTIAAYRFGHSMVREEYSLNDNFDPTSMATVFQFINVPQLPVRSNWVVDFNRFFDTGSVLPINKAKKIDTALAVILSSLPGQPAGFMSHLAKRNLKRGLSFGLITGQAAAKRLGSPLLTPAEFLTGANQAESNLLNSNNGSLMKKTPLWYYILKESEVRENGERLGRVGSKIVSVLFSRLLNDNPTSFINEGFTPTLPTRSGTATNFDFVDLLKFAGVLEQ